MKRENIAISGSFERQAGLSWIELLTPRHRVPALRAPSDSESETHVLQRGTLRYFHTPWLFKLLSREAIKPAAIKRAAELRQKMGLEPLPIARVEQTPARRHTARVADAGA